MKVKSESIFVEMIYRKKKDLRFRVCFFKYMICLGVYICL